MVNTQFAGNRVILHRLESQTGYTVITHDGRFTKLQQLFRVKGILLIDRLIELEIGRFRVLPEITSLDRKQIQILLGGVLCVQQLYLDIRQIWNGYQTGRNRKVRCPQLFQPATP